MMLTSFILIFMAEMADKTQLLVLALSRRYSLRSVIAGMTLSIVLLSLLSVWAGSWLNACIPIDAIRPAAAVLFLLFGFSALKPKPDQVKEGRRFHADWLSVAAAFFIAELGDKTQISALTLAAQHDAHAAIFLGSCLGLLAANLLALAAGRFLMKHISDSAMRLFSATVFFLFGSWTLFQLFSPTQLQIVIYCLILFLSAYLYALWQERRS